MQSRWMISEDGVNFSTEFFPINGADVTYTYDRELSNGQIFFRTKLASELKFGGPRHKAEYTYFWNAFRSWAGNNIGRCGSIYIRQELMCGMWKVIWTGEFSPASGHFDKHRCLYSVKPEPMDRYTCILRRMDKKYNVLDQDSETLDVPIMSQLDIVISQDDLTGVQDYAVATSITDGYGCTIYVNWQERVKMPCSAGSPSAPSTPGWTLRVNVCDQGYSSYTRPVTIGWSFGTPTPGSYTYVPDDPEVVPGGPDCVIPDDSCDWVAFGLYVGCYDGSPGQIASERLLPYYLCRPVYSIVAHTTTLSRARDLGEALTAMYAPCGGTVISDFLELNPAGDYPGYTAGTNYVTGDTNRVSNLKMFQLSDVVTVSSNAATVGETTLKDMLGFLQSMRLFWDIDDDGNLRIEHWVYWQSQQGLDITRLQNTEAESFSGLDEKPAASEVCKWVFSKGTDFTGVPITYAPPCASEDTDKPKVYDFKGFTTDLPIIIETRATNFFGFTKDGFLIVACEAGSTDVTYENGALTGTAAANMHMSWANLHDNYWTWDRPLPNGNMNTVDTEFDGFVANVKQDEFGVDLCCLIFDFNPRDSIRCRLSVFLSDHVLPSARLAEVSRTNVKRATFRPSTGWARLTLLHAYR
jgi:hypothetical protein